MVERLLPFVTTYNPATKKLKQIKMENWSLIENQPPLKTLFKKPHIMSYKREKSLQKTCSLEQNYNLKALIMWCNHKNHTGSPCRLSLFFTLSVGPTYPSRISWHSYSSSSKPLLYISRQLFPTNFWLSDGIPSQRHLSQSRRGTCRGKGSPISPKPSQMVVQIRR